MTRNALAHGLFLLILLGPWLYLPIFRRQAARIRAGVPNARPTANTIIERREETASTLFGNVLDLSAKGHGYVRNVTQGGAAELGYGTLRIETQDGELIESQVRAQPAAGGDRVVDFRDLAPRRSLGFHAVGRDGRRAGGVFSGR